MLKNKNYLLIYADTLERMMESLYLCGITENSIRNRVEDF